MTRLALLLCVCLVGCATLPPPLTYPTPPVIPLDELSVTPPPSEDEVWPLDDSMDAPMVVPLGTWLSLVEAWEKYPHLRGGWQDERRERLGDQSAALAHDERMRALLKQSRAGQVRCFVAGAGVGAAVTTCIIVGVAAALAAD